MFSNREIPKYIRIMLQQNGKEKCICVVKDKATKKILGFSYSHSLIYEKLGRPENDPLLENGFITDDDLNSDDSALEELRYTIPGHELRGKNFSAVRSKTTLFILGFGNCHWEIWNKLGRTPQDTSIESGHLIDGIFYGAGHVKMKKRILKSEAENVVNKDGF